ncbi:MAG: LacI family DNA-binding transcriptional regulator [Kiritimatiellae bacterium]|nr:LacI family DNA-binding transcriptional regulator [Kiritimatiellia bacterium]
MHSKVTLRDVCREAGVSKATISHVLNNKPGVGMETRKRVLEIIEKMGYRPKPAARHLSLARTETLACVFEDLTPGWLLSIYRGILSKAAEMKYHVITALSVWQGDQFELPTNVLGTASVDGLLWLDPRTTPDIIRRFKQQQRMPFVVLQGHLDDPDITTISIEEARGAYLAVKHLVERGRRRIMLITGQEDNYDSQQKLLGSRQALSEAGLSIAPEYILNGHHVDDYAIRAVEAFVKAEHPLPDAIFAFNDNMALAVMRWLMDRGIRVPDDVAIVGFDGIDDARRAGLTTVETPMREMGMLAVQTLIELIHTPAANRKAQHIMMGGTLAARRSTGAA